MPIKLRHKYVFLMLFLIFNLLEADFVSIRREQWDNKSSKKYMRLLSDQGFIYPYPEECTVILDIFAQSASDFTLCSIKKARPISLCTSCIDQYVKFNNKYEELGKTVINGTSCLSIFISQDRLDVVLDYHDHIASIWQKGHCDDCFVWSNNIPKLSNNTILFNKMYHETIDCITDNNNGNNSDEVCKTCMPFYLRLDDFYKTLSKDSIGVDNICMDIVDSMNTTRSIWSKTLNCCKLRRTPQIIFLCCTAIISLLPLLFYVAVRYCGPIRDLPNVLKESRFKQSILRSVQGRIN